MTDNTDEIRAAMAGFTLPSSSEPAWARAVSEDEWKTALVHQLRTQSVPYSRTQKLAKKQTKDSASGASTSKSGSDSQQ